MKKTLLFLIAIVFASITFAQAPQAFKFQTLVRDGNGEVLPLQDITLKFQIRKDSPEGDVAYAEQHFVTTNALGLVSLNIGGGEPIFGTFGSINWGDGTYFLEELIDIGNTGDFQVFGTVQLLSVPYALHANTSGNGIQSMSTDERNALENPAVGTQIYNTTTNCLNYWSGSNWFETCGDCTPQPDNANAGPDQEFFDSTTIAQLEANIPEFGQGEWIKTGSFQGYFDDPTDPNTQFHGEPCKVYFLKWTISTSCGSNTDNVKVSFDDTPSQAQAGADIIINSDTTAVSLDALVPENGDGLWSVISGEGGSFDDPANPAAQFTGLDCEMYQLLWKVSTECHFTTDTLNVEFYAIPTTAMAGADTTINDESLTINLNANTPEVGTGEWSIISGEGGTLAEATNPNTEFTAQPCETYDLVWAISTACEMSSDTMTAEFYAIPTPAIAGADTTINDENLSITINANTPEVGTGTWSIISGEGGILAEPGNPVSLFTAAPCETYELVWTISTDCEVSADTVTMEFYAIPTQALAGADTTINNENLTITLNGNTPEVGTGAWSIISGEGGTLAESGNPVSEFTVAPCETYELVWTISTACEASADTVTMEFYAIPTQAIAGADTTINNENLTITLNANTPEVGTGAWSIISGDGGMLADPGNPVSSFSAALCETYKLVWTISTACEVTVDTVKIDFFTLPTTADAGEDQLDLIGTWTNLTANTPEIGEGQWTILSGEGGQITNPTSPTSIFLGQNMEYYILQWKITTQCDTARDEVNIAFGFTPFLNCGDTLTDTRDGQKYTTVKIGDQCWMAENLAYLPDVSPSAEGSDSEPYYYVYDYQGTDVNDAKNTENFQNYGSLYNWPASLTACPTDWHLPTDAEWTVLTDYVSSQPEYNCNGITDYIAKALAATTNWNSSSNTCVVGNNLSANNASSFSGLPGGNRYYNGAYNDIENSGLWWSSTETSTTRAWYRYMYCYYTYVGRHSYYKAYGFSVRCLRD